MARMRVHTRVRMRVPTYKRRFLVNRAARLFGRTTNVVYLDARFELGSVCFVVSMRAELSPRGCVNTDINYSRMFERHLRWNLRSVKRETSLPGRLRIARTEREYSFDRKFEPPRRVFLASIYFDSRERTSGQICPRENYRHRRSRTENSVRV